MGIVFLVLQIVFDILVFISYMRLNIKIDDTHEYVEIDSVRIRHIEKQSDIFKDSIKLQNDSLRDVFDLTKKVIEYNEPKESAEKPDTKAVVTDDFFYTVQPERKKGEWKMEPDPYGFFEEIPVCSECGRTTEMRKTYNFCPNCGVDMRGEKDG